MALAIHQTERLIQKLKYSRYRKFEVTEHSLHFSVLQGESLRPMESTALVSSFRRQIDAHDDGPEEGPVVLSGHGIQDALKMFNGKRFAIEVQLESSEVFEEGDVAHLTPDGMENKGSLVVDHPIAIAPPIGRIARPVGKAVGHVQGRHGRGELGVCLPSSDHILELAFPPGRPNEHGR